MSESQSLSEPALKTLRQRFAAVRSTVHKAISVGLSHPSAKPEDVRLLRRTAFSAAEDQHNQSEEAIKKAQEVAKIDPLTGLPHKGGIVDKFDEADALSRRLHLDLSIGVLDLIGLGATNKALGHIKADEILRDIAHGLRSDLRESDIVGRFGGDEFAIVMPGADAELANKKIGEIQEKLSKVLTERYHYPVGFRFKIAQQNHTHPKTYQQLFEEADPKLIKLEQ